MEKKPLRVAECFVFCSCFCIIRTSLTAQVCEVDFFSFAASRKSAAKGADSSPASILTSALPFSVFQVLRKVPEDAAETLSHFISSIPSFTLTIVRQNWFSLTERAFTCQPDSRNTFNTDYCLHPSQGTFLCNPCSLITGSDSWHGRFPVKQVFYACSWTQKNKCITGRKKKSFFLLFNLALGEKGWVEQRCDLNWVGSRMSPLCHCSSFCFRLGN